MGDARTGGATASAAAKRGGSCAAGRCAGDCCTSTSAHYRAGSDRGGCAQTQGPARAKIPSDRGARACVCSDAARRGGRGGKGRGAKAGGCGGKGCGGKACGGEGCGGKACG